MHEARQSELLTGRYFPYCQLCAHDGNCALLHHEFLGLPSSGLVDRAEYASHEDLALHMTVFQNQTRRGTCGGRIHKTGSIFYPLHCECGTVLSSLGLSEILGGGFCQKFIPNEKGMERKSLAERLAKERGVDISEVIDDLPELDPDYCAEMKH